MSLSFYAVRCLNSPNEHWRARSAKGDTKSAPKNKMALTIKGARYFENWLNTADGDGHHDSTRGDSYRADYRIHGH